VQRNHPVRLACLQFLICAFLSLGFGAIFESCSFAAVKSALIPLLYAGIFSIAISFTLQMIAQRTAPPAHAAVLLSMEAVFAVVGGFLILQERLTLKAYCGCVLLLLAMIISQSAHLKALDFTRKSVSC
ncbi:MAG: DMT family transporter, partial [Candidatus Cloacimonetes bacterium]|nr:DMT family transporter [Candidatus Cloacimonadota bacterium]